MITSVVPDSWQDLQHQTARILEECGFDVELEKKIQTVRGEVEIDVYAEEIVKGRKYRILCECKHWKTRVPQNVIHGFRTVVADIGANVGYLISLNGFQSGAFSAAELTNLELVDWEQFQLAFEETWYDEYLSPQIVTDLDPLLTYAEPLAPKWYPDLPDLEKQEYVNLKGTYDELGWMLMTFTPYARMGRDKARPKLPLRESLVGETSIPAEILDVATYREFHELCVSYGLPAIEQFRAIRDRNAV
jgi:restriction system protein